MKVTVIVRCMYKLSLNSPSLLGLPISDHRNTEYDPKSIPTYFLVPPLCVHASGIAVESDTGDLLGMSS